MKSYTVVGVAHHGELVCKSCLSGEAEKAVFHGGPDAQKHQENDGYLSAVFAADVEQESSCGRCNEPML